ncbi:MAG: hypothetical protein GH155_06950 [Spirochaeta sp.]|nr:hypothetical protein [Spirochaeta sp.]
MQVYRYLDIGSAKPSRQTSERIKYHLIDLVKPSFQFNAGMFVHHTEDLIREISGRRKFPVIVGGTAFYLRNFIFGLPLTDRSPPDEPEGRNEKSSPYSPPLSSRVRLLVSLLVEVKEREEELSISTITISPGVKRPSADNKPPEPGVQRLSEPETAAISNKGIIINFL